MSCPHCGAEHPEEAGRFCRECGLSVIAFSSPATSGGDEPPLVRCRNCGSRGHPPVCPSCGQRLRAPEPE